MADIFRKKSLEKLSSPEQLDKMIVINSPMVILALAGGAFIIIVALIWGIIGRVPMTEEGSGIILRDGEVKSVYAQTQGVITKVHVSGGDTVKEGDLLFEVASEEMGKTIEELDTRIAAVEAVTFTSSNDVVTSDNQALMEIKNQSPALSLESDAYSAQLSALQKQYNKKKTEVSSKKTALDNAETNYRNNPSDPTAQAAAEVALSEYNTAKSEMKALENSISEAEVQVSVGNDAESVQRATLRNNFDSTKAAILDELKKEQDQYLEMAEGWEIKANADGTIYTTFVTNGSSVTINMEVARISEPGKEGTMQAVYYMPLESGKKVEKGMEVNIYPSTYAKEEYGHMTGTVVGMTDYVTSYADLYTRLGDQTLTDTFAAQGAVMEIVCEIDTDDSTASGFAWSSRKGESVEVKEGTLLGGSVVLEDVPPITMLIPKLKEKFNMQIDPNDPKEAAAADAAAQ